MKYTSKDLPSLIGTSWKSKASEVIRTIVKVNDTSVFYTFYYKDDRSNVEYEVTHMGMLSHINNSEIQRHIIKKSSYYEIF